MNQPEQPILDVAHGDKALSQQVSRALQVIAQHSTEPDLKNQIGEIVRGESSARDLMNSAAFNRILDSVAPEAIRWAAETSDEERARLAEQGQAELDRLRAESTAPDGPAGPSPQVPDDRSGDRAGTGPEAPHPRTGEPVHGARKSWRDVVVTPQEPDEDDLYFQDRRRRGWLE